jgi:hypothetical protein
MHIDFIKFKSCHGNRPPHTSSTASHKMKETVKYKAETIDITGWYSEILWE